MQTEIKHEAERLADAAKTNLMIEGTIWKQLLLFSIPLILGNLLQQMYNTADSIIVGQSVGSNALAAVSASTSLINLLIAFSQGASVGAGVIVSQYLGARDREGVHSSVHTALAIAAILGLALTVVTEVVHNVDGMAFADPQRPVLYSTPGGSYGVFP